MASSKANMDPVFEALVRGLRDGYKASAEAARVGVQAKWDAPPLRSWSGSPDDVEGMSAPFDRSAANADFAKAVADPDDPGTTGDLVASAVQAHYTGVAERAFRLRRLRGVRAAAHAAARSAALGDDNGPLMRGAVENVRNVLARGKGASR